MVERFEDLPRTEQISIFIQEITAHEKEAEIYYLLTLFTAYNVKGELAERFIEFTIDQIIELLNNNLISGDYDEEQDAWEIIIETLGTDKIWDIIDDINFYINQYNKIRNILEDLEGEIMEMYTKI